ncbi:MAG: GYDIA family GHMP kinase [Flavobacteriaceae bacterium]
MQIYKHGKLLLTAEYAVLDGACALALPTVKGQKFTITQKDQANTVIWQALDCEGKLWFWAEIRTSDWTVIKTNETGSARAIIQLLKAIHTQNPSMFSSGSGLKIKCQLEFPQDWGLGSSSTLIAAMAEWSKTDPYWLSKKTFGGSGYDLAAANMNGPFIYQLSENGPKIKTTPLNWPFKDQLYFIHRNKKQNSRESIAHYRNRSINEAWLNQINDLTQEFVQARDAQDFGQLIRAHESAIAEVLNLIPVKQELFPDFKGEIKSLGGWGGDFMLALGPKSSPDYFKAKGFPTVISFTDMVR